MKKLIHLNYRHYICIVITLGFLALAIFKFKYAPLRIWESLIDIKNSFLCYLAELFEFNINYEVTINDFTKQPFKMPWNLPNTWEEFKELCKAYGQLFLSKENLLAYLNFIGDLLYYISKILIIIMPFILIIDLILNNDEKQNNDYNQDTKALKWWKSKFERKFYLPIKNWILEFIQFIKDNSFYFKIWLFIWAYNFNIITMFIEFIAYYLYFVSLFDLVSIYRQVLKFLMDFSIAIDFIPIICWIIIFIWIFDILRKRIAYNNLDHMEMMNRGFINERPIVSMTNGGMGSDKTKIVTDMAISQEIMFRDKAFELILECDLKFPNFPWINLENAIKQVVEHHMVYNLASCKQCIKSLKKCFYMALQENDKAIYKSIKRHIKKKYNLNYENLCFDYDYERYGFYYDNKLYVDDIWKVIEDYTQLYFVYIIQSSLLISNYSIRTDNILEDLGNFPLWNTDLFKRDSRMIDSFSRHAHILDFDTLRLGKKVIEDNPKANMFEFGVINITEVGKERKNNLELQVIKALDDLANQKNDLFNDTLKMIRHSATICNFPFVKIFTDEQRPESWGADARDLCELIHSKKKSNFKLALPGFALEDLFCQIVLDKFNNKYYNYRFHRGDNTLSMYLLHGFAALLHKYRTNIYNTFGYYKREVSIEVGTMDERPKESKYYIMFKKIYSKRYSTDCFSEYFNEKALCSNIGLDDLEEYETERASFDEMLSQNSYFFNSLNKYRKKGK